MSESFERIVIIPTELFSFDEHVTRVIPENCEVLNLNDRCKKSRLSGKWIEFFRIFFFELIYTRKKSHVFKRIKKYFSVLRYQQLLADELTVFINEKVKASDFIFYSYWFHNSATMLSILKMRGKINHYVSRAHSVDLYEWDWAGVPEVEIIPYYSFRIKMVGKLLSVSSHGCQYLVKRFPKLEDKFKVSKLGVDSLGSNPWKENGVFTIVSCSSIQEIKKVYIIASVIKKLNFPVEWFHFGDGKKEDKSKVADIVSTFDSSKKAHLVGFLPNEDIRSFYQSEGINLFVNLSEMEGIPVTLMEAISFGIPVLATRVYGNPEIACEETGFCVDSPPNIDLVAELIGSFYGDKEKQIGLRNSAGNFYFKNYNANRNYQHFIDNYLLN